MPSPPAHRPERGRLALGLGAILISAQLWIVLPLALGRETLFLRDVLITHLEMKRAEATVIGAGQVPFLDPFRGGGQPHAGNPNAAPFYPTTVLFWMVPAIWALNAHFWIHFLIAPWSAAWLARAWGARAPAAIVGGAVYALSGFFLAQMSYFNLVAGAALVPALIACALVAWRRGGAWFAGVGALLALVALAGDPFTAAQGLGLAALAVTVRDLSGGDLAGRRAGRWGRLALAVAAALLLASPQIAELLRALPASFRGEFGYSAARRTIGSFHPVQVLELLLPTVFGRIDRLGPGSFWAQRWFQGQLPYFLALSPGLLGLALPTVAGRAGRGGRRWCWLVVALGLFVATGRYNPLLAGAWDAAWLAPLRFPVRAWLAVAIGLSVLAALGADHLLDAEARGARRRFAVLAGLAAVVLAAGAVAWRTGFGTGLPDLLLPPAFPFRAEEVTRWSGLAARGAAVAAGLALAVVLIGRRPRLGIALLVAIHAVAQVAFLAPVVPTDDAAPYSAPHPFASRLAPGERIVHGSIGGSFGPSPLAAGTYPTPESRWLARRAARELYPFMGVGEGLRYELAVSPEGLDGYLTRAAADAVAALPEDGARLRLLRGWGVRHLLLARPLGAGAGAEQVGRLEHFGGELRLYAIDDPVAPVRWVGRAFAAADPRSALVRLLARDFDPRAEVVIAGTRAFPRASATGRVVASREQADRVDVRLEAPGGGWLVVDQAWQPQWRATVDGRPAEVLPANLQRMAVPLPAGAREVRLAYDRGPFRRAVGLSAVGALTLLGLAWSGRRPRPVTPPRPVAGRMERR